MGRGILSQVTGAVGPAQRFILSLKRAEVPAQDVALLIRDEEFREAVDWNGVLRIEEGPGAVFRGVSFDFTLFVGADDDARRYALPGERIAQLLCGSG